METQTEFAIMPAPAPLDARMEATVRAAGATADDLRVLALYPDDHRRKKLRDFLVHFRAGGLVSHLPTLEDMVEGEIKNRVARKVGGITLVGTARFHLGLKTSNNLGAFYVVALLIKRPDFRPYLDFKEGAAGLLFRHAWNPFAERADDAR